MPSVPVTEIESLPSSAPPVGRQSPARPLGRTALERSDVAETRPRDSANRGRPPRVQIPSVFDLVAIIGGIRKLSGADRVDAVAQARGIGLLSEQVDASIGFLSWPCR